MMMIKIKFWILILIQFNLIFTKSNDKAKVKLSDILKENNKYRLESWPPDEQDRYFQVNVKLLGDKSPSPFDASFKPLKQHLNKKKLKKLFWKYNLDLEWLSINKPDILKGLMKTSIDSNVPKELKEATKTLNFTFVDKVGTLLEIPTDMQNMFKTWLIRYSSCQMSFVWEDLGDMFWPRWIRRGICDNSRSCSWPNGMGCKFSNSRTLYLLRWNCEPDKSGKKSYSHQMYMMKLKERKIKRKIYRTHKRRRVYRRNKQRRNNRSLSTKMKRLRAARIIKRLARPIKGHYCQWRMIKYYISDKCSCQCK